MQKSDKKEIEKLRKRIEELEEEVRMLKYNQERERGWGLKMRPGRSVSYG